LSLAINLTVAKNTKYPDFIHDSQEQPLTKDGEQSKIPNC